jgi:hypothetical protein
MQNKSIELTYDVKRSPEVLGPLLSIQFSSLLRWPPKRVQLSLSEKNTIAALHKAGLKGPAITRETGYPLSTVYGVFKRFRQHATVEK